MVESLINGAFFLIRGDGSDLGLFAWLFTGVAVGEV